MLSSVMPVQQLNETESKPWHPIVMAAIPLSLTVQLETTIDSRPPQRVNAHSKITLS